MTINFDPQRSDAIRAGLVAAATSAEPRRRPWRGLALLLAGVLVGGGAATAAFANGQGPTPSPSVPASPSSSSQPQPRSVVVVGSPDDEEVSGRQPRSVIVTNDGGSAKAEGEYQWQDRLREVSRVQLVVSEPHTLDLSAHPAEASLAWVVFSCRGHGAIAMVAPGVETSFEITESGVGDTPDGPGPAVATMLKLDGSSDQFKPVHGCTADVSVTYYAK